MNPAILVLSHPNTEEKERIVKDFGNFIKQFKLPTYLFTNFPTSKSSELEYDGSFFHSYNPKINSGANFYVWSLIPDTNLKYIKNIPNWGYSGTHLAHLGFKFLKMMGYTHVFFFTYDVEMDYPKVKKFIDLGFNSFKSNKKGVFLEYPYLNEYAGISTNAYSCEVDFFINTFGEMLDNYGPNHPITNENNVYTLENLFEYVLRPYMNEIEIAPLHEALKDTYTSADNRPLPDGSKYLVGYSKIHNKVLITTKSLNFKKLKVMDKFGKTLDLELIIETNNTKIFQFAPELNSIFNLKFDNQSVDTILYNDDWKNNVYFIEQ